MSHLIRDNFKARRLQEVAKLLGLSAILLGVLTFLFSRILEKPLSRTFFISFFIWAAIWVCGTFLRRIRDRNEAGQQIADLGEAPTTEKSIRLSVLLNLLVGIFCIILGLDSESSSHLIWLGATILLMQPILLSYFRRTRYEIRENGLFLGPVLLRWKSITNYEWDGPHLWVQTTGDLLQFRDCRVTIAEDQKESVDQFLREHLRHITSE